MRLVKRRPAVRPGAAGAGWLMALLGLYGLGLLCSQRLSAQDFAFLQYLGRYLISLRQSGQTARHYALNFLPLMAQLLLLFAALRCKSGRLLAGVLLWGYGLGAGTLARALFAAYPGHGLAASLGLLALPQSIGLLGQLYMIRQLWSGRGEARTLPYGLQQLLGISLFYAVASGIEVLLSRLLFLLLPL